MRVVLGYVGGRPVYPIAGAGGGDVVGSARIRIEPDMTGFDAQMAARVGSAVGAAGAASQRSLQQVAATAGQLGSTLTRSITLPIVGASVAAVKLGSDFERELSKVIGLVGRSREEVGKMREGVLELAKESGRAPKELAEGLFFVTSAGFKGAEAMSVLEAAAKAAAAGLGDTATIADAVTSAVNAYGLENLSAGKATDILTAAVREGKLEASSLAPVLGNLLPTASNLGIGFEQVAGALAVFSRTGTDAASGATSLNSIMTSLIKPTEQSRKALADVGLEFSDLRKQAAGPDGLIGVMRSLDEAFGDNEEALAQIFPNVRAFRGVMNALGQDASTVDDILSGVANSTGAASDAFEAAAETSGFKFEQAMASIKVALIEVGDILAPIAAKVVSGIAAMVSAFGRLPPGAQKIALAFAGIAAAIGPALLIFSKVILIGGQVTRLIGPIGGLSRAVGFLGTAFRFLLGPIGIIVSVLGLLFATNEEFREAVMGLVSALGTALAPILSVVAGLLGQVMDAVGPLLGILLDLVGAALTPLINALIPLVEMLGKVIEILAPAIELFFKFLTPLGLVSTAVESLGGVFGRIFGGVRKEVEETGRTLASLVGEGVEPVEPAVRKALEAAGHDLSKFEDLVVTSTGQIVGVFRDLDGALQFEIFEPGDWEKGMSEVTDSVDGLGVKVKETRETVEVESRTMRERLLGIAEGVGEALVQPFGVLKQLGSLMEGPLGDAARVVGRFFSETLPRAFGAAVEGIGNFFRELPGKIAGFIGSIGWETVGAVLAAKLLSVMGIIPALILKAALTWGPAALQGAASGFAGVLNWFGELPGRVMGLISTLGPLLLQAGATALQAMASGIGTGAAAVFSFFGSLPGRLLAAVALLPNMLLTLGSNALAAMARGVVSAGAAVLDWFRGLPGHIRSFLGSLVGVALEIGRAIIDGIVRGIKSAPGAIKNALIGMARGAWSAVKGFLRIGSPSRLFADIGQDIVKGLVAGVERTGGELERALKDIIPTTMAELPVSVARVAAELDIPRSVGFGGDAARELINALRTGGTGPQIVQNITVPHEMPTEEAAARAVAARLGREIAR